MSNYRKLYTRQEDQIIVNYVKEHPRYLKGRVIWKNLVNDTGLDRPWSSVQSRFKKFIIPFIRDKNIFPNVTSEEAQMILKSFFSIETQRNETVKNVSSNSDDGFSSVSLAESKSDASSEDDAVNETRAEATTDKSDSPKGIEIDDSDTTVLMADRERDDDVGFDTAEAVVRRAANETDRDSIAFVNQSVFSCSTVKLNNDASARRSVDPSDTNVDSSDRNRPKKSIDCASVVVCFGSSSDDTIKEYMMDDELNSETTVPESDPARSKPNESVSIAAHRSDVNRNENDVRAKATYYRTCIRSPCAVKSEPCSESGFSRTLIGSDSSRSSIDTNYSTVVQKHDKLSDTWITKVQEEKKLSQRTNRPDAGDDYVDLCSSSSSTDSSFRNFRKNINTTSSFIGKKGHKLKNVKPSCIEVDTTSSDSTLVLERKENINKKDHRFKSTKKIISRKRIVEAEASSSDDSVVLDVRPKANTKGSARGNTKENVSEKTSTSCRSMDFFRNDETDKAVQFLRFDHNPGLRMYTLAEDLVIIKCVLRKIRSTPRLSPFGDAIFKEMESKKILDRTWQSLKDRFKRRIFPNLNRYNLPAKKLDILKSCRKR